MVKYESEQFNYTIERTYTPDFVIEYPDGHKLYIEAKGFFRWEDMEKIKNVKRCNPTIDLRMVFQIDKKVRKNSKMRYSDWCNKHDIPFSVGSVPKEWLE